MVTATLQAGADGTAYPSTEWAGHVPKSTEESKESALQHRQVLLAIAGLFPDSDVDST